MASRADIQAGRAFVRLFLKNDMTRQLVRALKAAQTRLRKFGDSAIATGRRVAFVGLAMATPFVFATRTFAEFEDQMLTVKVVTRDIGDAFETLTEQAKTLGRTTSFTAIQIGQAMVQLGRATFSADEIKKATPHVLNLARATGTDLAEATEIAAVTLRQFKLDASQMERVVDVMTATANNSVQTLSDLGQSMVFGAQIANKYGLEIEEVGEMLGILATQGLKGTIGGTALRKIMLELANPDVQNQLRAKVVEPLDDLGELKNPLVILRELGVAMADMTNPQQIALLRDMFDIRAVGSSVEFTTESLLGLQEAIANSSGTTRRAAAEMDSGLGGAFRRLTSVIESVKIEIGGALAPVLQKLSKIVTANLRSFSTWIKANKGMVVAAASAVAGIIIFGTALVTVGVASHLAAFSIAGLLIPLKLIGFAASAAAFGIGALLIPLKLVGFAFSVVIGVMRATGKALSFTANLISGTLTVALFGLKGALKVITVGFHAMAAAVIIAIDTIVFIGSAIQALALIAPILAFFAVLLGIGVIFKSIKIAANTAAASLDAVEGAIDGVRSAVGSAGSAVVSFSSALFSAGTAVDSSGTRFSNFAGKTRQAFIGMADAVKGAFRTLVTDVGKSWKTLQALLTTGDFTEAWALGLSLAKLEWVRFKNWLLNLWEDVTPVVNAAIINTAKSIGGILTNLQIAWGDIWDALQEGLRTFLRTLDTALDSVRVHIAMTQAFFGADVASEQGPSLESLVPRGRSAEAEDKTPQTPDEISAAKRKDERDTSARERGKAVTDAITSTLVTTEKTPVEMAAIIAARGQELDNALKDYNAALITAKEAVKKQQAIDAPAPPAPPGAPGPAGAPGGTGVARDLRTAAPLGSRLTATFSAEAARISGFQAAGPEAKMAAGIDQVAKSTNRMDLAITKMLGLNERGISTMEQYLATMRTQ